MIAACVSIDACGSASPPSSVPSPGPSPQGREVAFAFPLRDRGNVKGLVAFGAYGAANPHNGIDFRPFDRLQRMEVVAPETGEVTAARVVEFGGLRHVQVDISVDSLWGLALVFEPMTNDSALFERQVAAVTVRQGERVKAGDPVGALLLGGTAGPPTVHFLVTRGTAVVCPYNYSTAQARADYDFIAASGPENYLPEGKICVIEEIPQ